MKLNRRQLRRLIESTILEQEVSAPTSSNPEKITVTYQATTDQYTVPANSEKIFHVYIKDDSSGVMSRHKDYDGNILTTDTSQIGFILNGKMYVTEQYMDQSGSINISHLDGYEIKRGDEPNELIIKNHSNKDFKFALMSDDGP